MPSLYSRRSFLTGALACGAFSAASVYLLPGGRGPLLVTPDVHLNLVSGHDPTGVRADLIRQWNLANPHVQVTITTVVTTGTTDERQVMKGRAESGMADIINVDVIHVPEFAASGLIAPIRIDWSPFCRCNPAPRGRVRRVGPLLGGALQHRRRCVVHPPPPPQPSGPVPRDRVQQRHPPTRTSS